MTTLVEFLNARLDEDERIALAATPGPWTVFGRHAWGVEQLGCVDGHMIAEMELCREEGHGDRRQADAEHVAHHDPTRALAEVSAKRQIIAAYDQRVREANLDPGGPWGYHSTGIGLAIRYLASSYSGHPDYLREWAP